MRNYLAAAVVTAALMIPAAASAAVLEKGAGVGCPDGQQGTFAFTVNQTTSTDPGTVTASFDSGETWTVGPHHGEQEDEGVLRQRAWQAGERELVRSTASSFSIASGASHPLELSFGSSCSRRGH